MPKETSLAARNTKGETLLYHDSVYPSQQIIDTFEKYYPGASRELLEMVRIDQANVFTLENRNSKLQFTLRVLGMTFAFILTLGMIGVGALLIVMGHAITGCLSLFMGILSIIGVIATGGQSEKNTKKK